MPKARLQVLPRPEGGAEREVIWETHHNCPQGKALRGELGEDIDVLFFGVGVIGYEMPSGIPFQVVAADDCRACGARLAMWFEWSAPSFFGGTGGRLWTPA